MATTTIVSSEVDSPSTWLRPRKIVSAGTKRMPPPTPIRPPARPPTAASRIAISKSMVSLRRRSRKHQLDRDRDQEQGEEQGDGTFRDPLLERGAEQDPPGGRERKQKTGADVDVAVDAALREHAEHADDDYRGEAGTGCEALAEAEPEDQQGNDDRAAADAEEAAEDAGEGSDDGQPQEWVSRHRAILDAVPGETASTNGDARADLLEALRAD